MRRFLFFVCAIVFADAMLYAALGPLLPGYASELGLSKGEAGLIVAAYAAGALAGALPGGLIAAHLGPKRAVLVGLALMAVASVAFGFASSAWPLGLARLAQGVGSALSWAGALAWLVALTPRSRRGEMLGTAIGSAIFGALFGPFIGAAADNLGHAAVFAGVAALAVGLALWAVGMPDAAADPQPLRRALAAVRDPAVAASLWFMVLPGVLFGVLAVLVPLELGGAGWTAAAIALVFTASAAIEMVVAPVLGRLSDRRGRLAPLRFALATSVVAMIAFALAGHPVVVALLVGMTAIAFGSFWAPAMALLSEAAERAGLAQALAFGLMNGAWGAGNALGPSLGGGLAELAGSDAAPYGAMALVCLATLLGASRLRSDAVTVTPTVEAAGGLGERSTSA